jgi:hypothetical protein
LRRTIAAGILAKGKTVETDWYNRADAIAKRILQLRDSL